MNDRATTLALELLRSSPEYREDARAGAPLGNSVVGSLLSLPPHSLPRQDAERGVLAALRILDSIKPDRGGNYTLPRSGKPPLRFQGEVLAESDGQRQAGRDWTRWHELTVYRTTVGKYVVHVAYRTRYQGELEHDLATVADDPAAVGKILTDYDPASVVRGFPPHESYADRQAKLLAEVRARYAAQVSDLLQASPEFAENIA